MIYFRCYDVRQLIRESARPWTWNTPNLPTNIIPTVNFQTNNL